MRSKFVPAAEKASSDEPWTFQVDPSINGRISGWLSALADVLVEHYEPGTGNALLETPQSMAEWKVATVGGIAGRTSLHHPWPKGETAFMELPGSGMRDETQSLRVALGRSADHLMLGPAVEQWPTTTATTCYRCTPSLRALMAGRGVPIPSRDGWGVDPSVCPTENHVSF